MKKIVIFDLDGTLLNTIRDLGNAANHALASNGYPIHPAEEFPFLVGNGVDNLLFRALPEDSKQWEIVARIKPSFLDYYDSHNTDFTRPYAGIDSLLSILQKRGIAVAVASNKYQAATSRLIAHFFPEIDWIAVEGQNNTRPLKPDPQIVTDILSKSKCELSQVLYVGDSAVDMTTAHRAHVESVGVAWGFRPVAELEQAQADHVVETPEEILNFIDQ